ncbi:MAG TPA: tetratricopeptide repeat protein [Anaerohalosphaeraceae bacterium]|nr:tetratricopeptide repeat protein [Phycisphaerae bacterium]HOK95732.1 tetratricopeptide repeat protein [Anaerohalosphaeraceae bacterium]HOL32804.1 tetratricopeptide repeat protein [Anaerohalosphaeraceae bacterium]HOM76896.1 tetratricopeptide repeat protein [Anaerohalosphaeraceae bacterium]HPC64744.1 tetratricopeptide repeat protein [Anaerohalosphaeraceae bacterium]
MMRTSVIAAMVVPAMLLTGCENPRQRDAHLLGPQDIPALTEGQVFLAPGTGEVDYVEKLAAARDAYRQALDALEGYYSSVGNATKLQWVKTEIKTFDQMVKYQYLQPAEWTPENLTASDSIAEADALYRQATSLYNESGGMIIVANRAKLQQALGLFNQLIQQYPTSDKIDDAAYRAGRIYEYLKNYELAAVYYQRTFQWNDATPYPARFRAAQVLDQKLKMRPQALALYQLAVARESRYVDNVEYAKARIAAMSAMSPEVETAPQAPAEPVQ